MHYHARDMAVVRGRIEGAAVILASATPSIEACMNGAPAATATCVRLPSASAGAPAADPRVDLRREAIHEAAGSPDPAIRHRGHGRPRRRALLFLNRRGYAPLTLCRACAPGTNAPTAPPGSCGASLPSCPRLPPLRPRGRTPHAIACGTVDSLVPCGPGVERIAEEVAELSRRRTIVLSSDFPAAPSACGRTRRHRGGRVRHRHRHAARRQGLQFPLMTLVGVLDADIGLTSGDPRAAERTFQLLQQVTGRAGRGEKPGRALVQTWQPEHPVIAALISGDAEHREARVRELAGLPPFGRLAALIVSAAEREAAESPCPRHGAGLGAAARRHRPRARRGAARPHRPLPLPAPRQDGRESISRPI